MVILSVSELDFLLWEKFDSKEGKVKKLTHKTKNSKEKFTVLH